MAKPDLLHHPKFVRLARELGSPSLAIGVLELLWHHCYDLVDDVVGTAADIAWIVRWPEADANRLAAALLIAAFIDPLDHNPHVFRVHHLWEHAPRYVQYRRQRQKQRQPLPLPVPVPEEERTGALRARPPVDAVLTKLAFDTVERTAFSDLKDVLKERAARLGLRYDSAAINNALDVVDRVRRAPLEAALRGPARRKKGGHR